MEKTDHTGMCDPLRADFLFDFKTLVSALWVAGVVSSGHWGRAVAWWLFETSCSIAHGGIVTGKIKPMFGACYSNAALLLWLNHHPHAHNHCLLFTLLPN